MDWNVKWDWGNLVMFGSKASESPKELQLTDWGVEEEGELNGGSFNLSSGGSGTGGYGSDVKCGSSIKSSISASTDSSPKEGFKASNFAFEAFVASPDDPYKKLKPSKAEVSGDSPAMEASVGSVEPVIGLKLGKRTCETICAGSHAKVSSFPPNPASSPAATKKAKSSSQNGPIPCCQVEGCNLDLSTAKEYYRKHRVCDSHSKCPKVIVAGVARRFCQQCSRFHSMAEFDEKKRSCRRRLSDHNARRRKPQQETIQFNSARLSWLFYDSRQPMNLVLNHAQLINSRGAANSNWESTQDKFSITRGFTPKPERTDSTNGKSLLKRIQFARAVAAQSTASSLLFPSKGTTTEVPKNPGSIWLQDWNFLVLSLLSTNSWGSSDPEILSLNHPTDANQTSMPEHMMQAFPQGMPHMSSQYWQAGQHLSDPREHSLAASSHNGGSFQEMRLLKAPFDTDFYFNALN
ncbi:unnamed protein product [Withania somnifera]